MAPEAYEQVDETIALALKKLIRLRSKTPPTVQIGSYKLRAQISPSKHCDEKAFELISLRTEKKQEQEEKDESNNATTALLRPPESQEGTVSVSREQTPGVAPGITPIGWYAQSPGLLPPFMNASPSMAASAPGGLPLANVQFPPPFLNASPSMAAGGPPLANMQFPPPSAGSGPAYGYHGGGWAYMNGPPLQHMYARYNQPYIQNNPGVSTTPANIEVPTPSPAPTGSTSAPGAPLADSAPLADFATNAVALPAPTSSTTATLSDSVAPANAVTSATLDESALPTAAPTNTASVPTLTSTSLKPVVTSLPEDAAPTALTSTANASMSTTLDSVNVLPSEDAPPEISDDKDGEEDKTAKSGRPTVESKQIIDDGINAINALIVKMASDTGRTVAAVRKIVTGRFGRQNVWNQYGKYFVENLDQELAWLPPGTQYDRKSLLVFKMLLLISVFSHYH